MEWIKKQITLAQQGMNENSSAASESPPLQDKGVLIMYCHVIKDDMKVQKNLRLDFYSGIVSFSTKTSHSYKKSFHCGDILHMNISNDMIGIEYRKRYSLKSKKVIKLTSNYEAMQLMNHFKFINENGTILFDLYRLMDRNQNDNIAIEDIQFIYHIHDIDLSFEQSQKMYDAMANPKEIITAHLIDIDDMIFDYIQFFHIFYKIWMTRDETYSPKSFRECLLNWLYYSKTFAAKATDYSEGSEQDEGASTQPIAVKIPLMPTETVHKIYHRIRWTIGSKPKASLSFAGDMLVTDYRIVFEMGDEGIDISRGHHRYRLPSYFHRLTVPLHSLFRVTNEAGNLQLLVKDLRTITVISSARSSKKPMAEEALLLLHRFAFPGSMRQLKLFAFKAVAPQDDWGLTDIRRDYQRMNIGSFSEWRVYDNSEWKLCESYPPFLIVPSRAKTTTLHAVAEHRSKGRLPVVTYRHASNGAVLLRSAQPLVGLVQKSSAEDEFLMECFRLRDHKIDDSCAYMGPKLYILDLRRQIAAAVNMATGKGTEDVSLYTNTELIFCNVENIHVMRSSASFLGDYLGPSEDDTGFLSKVEESGWLKHVSLVIAAARMAAEKLHLEGATVLCHCSDGFDRTSQMSSLTQILLDPFYRTFEGFATLIEKDWCAFGHKFKDRCGHGLDFNIASDERSPIFVQFLDAVHQLLVQFPTAFEFSDRLLVFLADHVYSCLYGNFIGNSYRQRHVELNVKERTRCIWSVVMQQKDIFGNSKFAPWSRPLWPTCALKRLVLWNRYFLRFDPSCHPHGLEYEDQWVDIWDSLFDSLPNTHDVNTA